MHMADSVLALVLESAVLTGAAFIAGESLIRPITTAARRNGASSATLRVVREGITGIWVAVVGVAHTTGTMEESTALTISGTVGLGMMMAMQTTLQHALRMLLLRGNILRLDDIIEAAGVRGQVVKIAPRNARAKSDKGDTDVIGNTLLACGPPINHSASTCLSKTLEVGYRSPRTTLATEVGASAFGIEASVSSSLRGRDNDAHSHFP